VVLQQQQHHQRQQHHHYLPMKVGFYDSSPIFMGRNTHIPRFSLCACLVTIEREFRQFPAHARYRYHLEKEGKNGWVSNVTKCMFTLIFLSASLMPSFERESEIKITRENFKTLQMFAFEAFVGFLW
jgi:hypothetical protein